MRYRDCYPYVCADKPAGVLTHRDREGGEGFVEYLTAKIGSPLLVSHRLDRDTSGAIVFSRTPEAAAHLTEEFRARRVSKTYLLVTDRDPGLADQVSIVSAIEKRGALFVSTPRADGNAASVFRRLRRAGRFTVWEVEPASGKPHQVRLHAADLGIPVLGDTQHGGSRFPRLLLHAQRIVFNGMNGEVLEHRSEPPLFFEELQRLEDQDFCAWLAALDRRRRLFGFEPESMLRLMHNEVPGLRCDRFGQLCWYYWYRATAPDPALLEQVGELTRLAASAHWKLQLMEERGAAPSAAMPLHASDDVAQWIGEEHGVRYMLRADRGMAAGLFLDQRRNRAFVQATCLGLEVLNLFCYTGGFGLAALKGGAALVANVDMSKAALAWARENVALNAFEEQRVEFWPADALYFMERCARRGRRFNLIICDPPSFARGRSRNFSIQRDLPALVTATEKILAPGGRLLFCTNFSGFNQAEFSARAAAALKQCETPLTIADAPGPDWDFELPGEEPQLKCVVVKKE